jgi:hypothetical protein
LNNLLDPGREKGETEEAVEEKPKTKRTAKPKTETAAAEETPAPKKRAKREAPAEEVTDNE